VPGPENSRLRAVGLATHPLCESEVGVWLPNSGRDGKLVGVEVLDGRIVKGMSGMGKRGWAKVRCLRKEASGGVLGVAGGDV